MLHGFSASSSGLEMVTCISACNGPFLFKYVHLVSGHMTFVWASLKMESSIYHSTSLVAPNVTR